MGKLIKLSISPNSPAIENVNDILIKATAPYSENNVTIVINPNITHYQEKAGTPNAQKRQTTITSGTNQTFIFDFEKNNVHNVKVDSKSYEIKLLNIDKEEFQGQNFPYFELVGTMI